MNDSAVLKIASIALPLGILEPLHYTIPENLVNDLKPGTRVKVPFRNKITIGLFIKIESIETKKLKYKLKNIISIIDAEPIISADLFNLIHWISDYYHYAIGEVFKMAIPNLLLDPNKEKTLTHCVKSQIKNIEINNNPNALELSLEQTNAVNEISKSFNTFNVFLLQGVTGSGKTEVYMRLIELALTKNLQALVLVPEINLTPQTSQRFKERFRCEIFEIHSELTEKQKLDTWAKLKTLEPVIIIGTRSSIFADLPNLGIIIIDEEHDHSFKQETRCKYNARDTSIMRAYNKNIPIILGSATPSMESMCNAYSGKYKYLKLTERVGGAVLPTIKYIDLKLNKLKDGISDELIKKITEHLNNNKQVLLFINRRGYAPKVICQKCGWIATCDRCDAALVYHKIKNETIANDFTKQINIDTEKLMPTKECCILLCHHCNKQYSVLENCSHCKSTEIKTIGAGTQKIENTLKKYFTNTPILRIDSDTTSKKNSFAEKIKQIHNQNNLILIGTQMLTKGHHFPLITLVGIIDLDYGFYSPDFRGHEHTAQLILQVAGRAGRQNYPGEVLIQTYNPQHKLLKLITQQDYELIAKNILVERKRLDLPPYSFMAIIRCDSKIKIKQKNFLQNLIDYINDLEINSKSNQKNINCYGPIPMLMEKKANSYRWQIIIQSQNRKKLQFLLKQITNKVKNSKLSNRVKWSIDVDPITVI